MKEYGKESWIDPRIEIKESETGRGNVCHKTYSQRRNCHSLGDWMLPELQEPYKGHFVPFVNEWISKN
jgi:hypothetical protein